MSNSTLTLTLMAGLPGVGKTTLARALGKELEWQIIDKDGRKEELLRTGLDDDKASYIAYDQSFEEVRNVLKRQRSVILDTATLETFILETAQDIVSRMKNVQLKVIFLVADRDLRNERIRRRPPQTTVIRVDPLTIHDYFQCFKHLPKFPDRFTLDTSKSLEKYQSRAKDYLVSNMSDREMLVDDEEELKRRSYAELVSQYSTYTTV